MGYAIEGVRDLVGGLTYAVQERAGFDVRRSPIVQISKRAHCLEAAILAADLLPDSPPTLVILDINGATVGGSKTGKTGYAAFLYEGKAGWGTIAKSKFPSLNGLPPEYPSAQAVVEESERRCDELGIDVLAGGIVNLDEYSADWREQLNPSEFVRWAKETIRAR